MTAQSANSSRPPEPDASGVLTPTDPWADDLLHEILGRVDAAQLTNIGFPVATDIDYRPLAPLLGHLLNNVGDPDIDPIYPGHAQPLEGNLYGLWLGRTKLPNAVVYHSTTAHYSVPKASHLLGLPVIEVAATPTGEIDYADLAAKAGQRRGRPGIVVANIGTTMTEAVDDVAKVHAALDTAGVTHRYVHADAALAGIPLACTPRRPAFDLADGADSISVSGHKFLGTPLVCGVVIARRGPGELTPQVQYIGSRDITISGSRNGLAVVMLCYAIRKLGTAGLVRRTMRARGIAQYAERQLHLVGWRAWRNRLALTVVLRRPPADVAVRWPLPTQGDWSHLICMPGVTTTQIDQLVRDLKPSGTQPQRHPRVPVWSPLTR